jgi:hypothetical protein
MVSTSLINDIATMASTSELQQQLCAVVTSSGKRLTRLTCNDDRNRKWRNNTTSIHAEEGAMLEYFGEKVFWDNRSGWCLKERKLKAKGEET